MMAVVQLIIVLSLLYSGCVHAAGVCEENQLCAEGCAPPTNTGSAYPDFAVAIEDAAKKHDKCKSDRCVPTEKGEDVCKPKCGVGKGCSVAYGCDAEKIPAGKWTVEQGNSACETGHCVTKESKFICEAAEVKADKPAENEVKTGKQPGSEVKPEKREEKPPSPFVPASEVVKVDPKVPAGVPKVPAGVPKVPASDHKVPAGPRQAPTKASTTDGAKSLAAAVSVALLGFGSILILH